MIEQILGSANSDSTKAMYDIVAAVKEATMRKETPVATPRYSTVTFI